MSWFGKKKLKEVDVAKHFSELVMQRVKISWPLDSVKIQTMVDNEYIISSDSNACVYFGIAVLTAHMQAMNNILPKEQATRMRGYILSNYPWNYREVVQLYEKKWDECLNLDELPFIGIASVLYEKVVSCAALTNDSGSPKNLFLLQILADTIIFCCGPWWKKLVEEFDIVP